MTTPKSGWTQTDDIVAWADNFSTFLSREKIQAQNCIRDCERYLNDPNVTSESLKEGLRDLMTKTEDNFGTLLHLERVMNMKNLGDYQNGSNLSSSSNPTPLLPQSTKDGAVQMTKTGRFRQQRVKSMDLESGTGFMFSTGNANEENFDPLQDEDLFDTHLSDSGEKKESANRTDNFDEDSGFTDAAYKHRPRMLEKQPLMMAKSMPVNVPMPEHGKLFLHGSPPDINEDTQDIPTKIAELAKSLHMDAIGELPSPRLKE